MKQQTINSQTKNFFFLHKFFQNKKKNITAIDPKHNKLRADKAVVRANNAEDLPPEIDLRKGKRKDPDPRFVRPQLLPLPNRKKKKKKRKALPNLDITCACFKKQKKKTKKKYPPT